MFFEAAEGGIWWLNAGTAEVSRVADSTKQFQSLLGTEVASDWFMPDLVERLHAAGKVPGPGQCFTYVTLPIFEEGSYDVSNLNPVDAGEHFAMTGHLHREIRQLPDGAKIKISVGS
jgi:hypothetical protein